MTLSALLFVLPLLAAPQDAVAVDEVSAADAAVIREQLPSYPLDACLISCKPLDSKGDPINMVVDGRLVRVCCKRCAKKVNEDPAAAIKLVDTQVVKAQKASYPLDKCVISGEPLGSMGDPVNIVVGTRLLRVCCKSCTKKVTKDPAPYLATINAALIEAQLATYPLDTCVVSGKEMSEVEEPVNLLYGTQLVRVCCKRCVKGFHKEPAPFLAEIKAATKPKKAAGKKGMKVKKIKKDDGQ